MVSQPAKTELPERACSVCGTAMAHVSTMRAMGNSPRIALFKCIPCRRIETRED